ncbi:hypothetical protein HOB94_06045, partial [bacterium]|nr:hypothetical protein [bacterium]
VLVVTLAVFSSISAPHEASNKAAAQTISIFFIIFKIKLINIIIFL